MILNPWIYVNFLKMFLHHLTFSCIFFFNSIMKMRLFFSVQFRHLAHCK
uniref:Uncharacterized protein n=1 Tax=Rhizophora mucronata TaxID=61149 RepID=A0A2P2N7F4_RHIMU